MAEVAAIADDGHGVTGQFGDDLRVYATLFDVTTMNIVKSLKEFATVHDVFNLSDRLAEHVGTAIEVELIVGAPAGFGHVRAVAVGRAAVARAIDTVIALLVAVTAHGRVADRHRAPAVSPAVRISVGRHWHARPFTAGGRQQPR